MCSNLNSIIPQTYFSCNVYRMAVKGKLRRSKTSRRHSKRKHGRTYKKRGTRCTLRMRRIRGMHGGNYARDVTNGYTELVPRKPLNQIVVTMPGKVAMSGTSYKALMKDISDHGSDDI